MDDKKPKALTGEVRDLNISPYTAQTLWSAALSENWKDLRRILKPVLKPGFAVTDAPTQGLVDDVRRLFDVSASWEGGWGCIHYLVSRQSHEAAADVLKMLLGVGVDPDLPTAAGGLRPAHICGWLDRAECAAAILLCRPDMAARNEDGETPLSAAMRTYKGDEKKQGRAVGCRNVAKVIIAGGYHKGEFPSLPELAFRKKWFAVRNVIRRQKVSHDEYGLKFKGRTAAEWALRYKRQALALEIGYYAGLPMAKLVAAENQFKSSRSQVAKHSKEVEALKVESNKDARQIQGPTSKHLQNELEEKKRDIMSQRRPAVRDGGVEPMPALPGMGSALASTSRRWALRGIGLGVAILTMVSLRKAYCLGRFQLNRKGV